MTEVLDAQQLAPETGSDAMEFPAAPPAPLARASSPAATAEPPIRVPGVGNFADTASAIFPTMGAAMDARQQEAEQMRIRANAMRPEYANITDALTKREALGGQVPQAPTLAPPPSRNLREFLAPSDNESPVTSIGKLVQALSLFATATVGTTRNNAVGALAAIAGAMDGWAKGDAERADAEFKTWEARTAHALKTYELQRAQYNDALTASDRTLDGRVQQARIKALEFGDTQAVLAFETGSLDKALGILANRDDAASKLAVNVAKLAQARQEAMRKTAADAETALHHRNTEAAAAAKLKADHEADAAHQLDPKAIELAAQQYVQNGQMPSMGMGKAATATKVAIMNRAAEIADATGGIEGQAARSAVYKATAGELAKVHVQRGLVMSFARTFDKNLDVALELSKKVDRSGAPVFNRWSLAGRQNVQGDVDVANFNAAVQTVVQEYSRVASGSTQVSDTARAEASKLINSAMTPEQFKGVAGILKRDTDNRAAGYEDQIKSIESALGRVKGGDAKRETLSRTDARYKKLLGRGMSDAQIMQQFGVDLN